MYESRYKWCYYDVYDRLLAVRFKAYNAVTKTIDIP